MDQIQASTTIDVETVDDLKQYPVVPSLPLQQSQSQSQSQPQLPKPLPPLPSPIPVQLTRSSSTSFRLGSSFTSNSNSAPTKFFGQHQQRNLRSSEARMRYAAAAAKDENNNNLSSHYNLGSLSHAGTNLNKRSFMAAACSIGQVKKWEKRLVAIDNSTLVLYRWIPIVVSRQTNT